MSSIYKVNRDTFSDITDMIKAKYPLMYLASTEYNRVMQWIRNIAYKNNYTFWSWDIVSGLQQHTREGGMWQQQTAEDPCKDPQGLLEHLLYSVKETADEKEIFLLSDLHRFFEEREMVVLLRKICEVLKAYNKPVLLQGPYCKLPSELEKYVNIVNVPLPDRQDLEQRLKKVVHDVGISQESLDEDLQKFFIDAALGMTDMEAELAFKLAHQKIGLDRIEAVNIISNEKEQIIKKSGLLDYYQVNEDLNRNVGGLDNIKVWLRQRGKAFDRKAKAFGLQEPKGMLLMGIPGCGKSLTAKCIASEWNQPLLRLDIGKVFQAEVGSSEANIREAIKTAEAVAPCILWIDEIEKGLNASGGEKDGGTNSRVFSTILTWMQEKKRPVFVVATANNINELPPELLRKGRFDEIFFVDLPTKEERAHIFRVHLEKNGQNCITDYEDLANNTKFFNGAEIEECVKEAMFLAYVENPDVKQISKRHLDQAIEKVVPLAFTMKKKIDGLREWSKTRARLASKQINDEQFEKNLNGEEIKLTKKELQEDIFGKE